MAECASSFSDSSSSKRSVCLEDYTDPRVLPCCHSYCLKCLEGIVAKTKAGKKLKCPQCRADHQVPSNGAKGFLVDYTVKESISKSQTQLCEQCDEVTQATSYCNTCCDYLCEDCCVMHRRLKPFRGHEISTKPKKMKHVYYCTMHPNKELELYCKGCQVLACTLCFVASHNGHDMGSTDSTARREVEASIDAIKIKADKQLTTFKKRLEYIKTTEAYKSKSLTKLNDDVNKRADTMIAEIEVGRKKLLKEAEELCTTEMKEIWSEKELHETTIAGLESTLAFTRKVMMCNEDTAVLALGKQVQDRLKDLQAVSSIYQLTEKAEVMVNRLEFLVQQPNSVGVILSEAEPGIQIIPSASNKHEVPLMKQINFSVEVHARPSTELKLTIRAQGEIPIYSETGKSKPDYQSVVLPAEVYGGGSYWTATCKPRSKGKYKVEFQFSTVYHGKSITKSHTHEFECNVLTTTGFH